MQNWRLLKIDYSAWYMTSLDAAILSFNNWSQPWGFYDYLLGSEMLLAKDKQLFLYIWTAALDKENWMDSDLTLGCKKAHHKIKVQFMLTDSAIDSVVRAASYQWK